MALPASRLALVATDLSGPAEMDASPESARPDKNLCADFRRTSVSNIKEIVQEVSHNVELQLIVLRCINNYKRSTSGGATLGQAVQAAQETRKSKRDMAEDSELEQFFQKDLLTRGRYLYKNWGIELYRMLFRYAVPWFTKSISNKVTDPERYRELMDWLFKVRVSKVNSEFDRIMSTSKKEVFDHFRDEYARQGDPLMALMDQLENGFINWPEVGCYDKSVEKDGDTITAVVITAKHLQGKRVHIPDDVLGSDDGWDTATLEANHSSDMAHLKTRDGEYNLKSLFPQLCKVIKRAGSSKELGTPVKQAKVEVKAEARGDTGGTAFYGRLAQPVLPPSPDKGVEVEAPEDLPESDLGASGDLVDSVGNV